MENLPLISVIVPIYNVESYLRECIESILNQSYQALEIILVNDGSTDRCLEICREYEKLDARIKLISKENGGLVSARKAGMLAAQGEYIGYVDADDWIDREMYQKMYERGIKQGADLVCVSSYKVYANGIIEDFKIGFGEGIYNQDEIRVRILPNWIDYENFFNWLLPLQTWRHLYKKELLWDNQLRVDDRVVMGEDVACVFPCYLKAERLCIINKYLYYYRQRYDSTKRDLPTRTNVGYGLLFGRINQCIEEYGMMQEILKRQALFFCFFSMLTASNFLFLEEGDIAFPFNISKRSNVVIYGAGLFGEKIYSSFLRMHVCNIKLWVDVNYERYENVSAPVKILDVEYDYVVLALLNAKTRDVVKTELVSLGVPEKKIADIDETLLTNDYLEMILEKKE